MEDSGVAIQDVKLTEKLPNEIRNCYLSSQGSKWLYDTDGNQNDDQDGANSDEEKKTGDRLSGLSPLRGTEAAAIED